VYLDGSIWGRVDPESHLTPLVHLWADETWFKVQHFDELFRDTLLGQQQGNVVNVGQIVHGNDIFSGNMTKKRLRGVDYIRASVCWPEGMRAVRWRD